MRDIGGIEQNANVSSFGGRVCRRNGSQPHTTSCEPTAEYADGTRLKRWIEKVPNGRTTSSPLLIVNQQFVKLCKTDKRGAPILLSSRQ